MSEQTIPVVDLRDFTDGDESAREQFVQTMGDGLKELGFFAVENHGVDSDLIQRAYAVTEEFFTLADDVKDRYEDLALKGQRGFTSFGREHAKGSDAPDLKEFWHVGRELPDDHPVRQRLPGNVWPDVLPNFKPIMLELYDQLETCAASLLEACALYVGEDIGVFRDMAVNGDTILRVIHYPPVADDADPSSIRAAAHEDINLITLLCESTAAGLELLQRDGSWRPIHALGGQIIVDSGDMIQNATNGLLKSTTHRVVNPDNSRERRFSMPFFVHPRPEVDLTPLASCVERTGGTREFADITAGEYLLQRLREIGLA